MEKIVQSVWNIPAQVTISTHNMATSGKLRNLDYAMKLLYRI